MSTLRECASCHSTCYACRGRSALNCTACPPPATLDTRRGSCRLPATPRPRRGNPPTIASNSHSPRAAPLLGLLGLGLGRLPAPGSL